MENMYQNYKTIRNINPLVLLLGLIFGLYMIFWFLKTIVFKVLYFIAPVLIIAALVFNYRVVLGYGKWLMDSFKGSPWFGIIATLLTIVGYPFVSAFLAYRAYQLRGDIYKKPDSKQGDYVKFEEIGKDDFLDIKKESKKSRDMDQEYGDLI